MFLENIPIVSMYNLKQKIPLFSVAKLSYVYLYACSVKQTANNEQNGFWRGKIKVILYMYN